MPLHSTPRYKQLLHSADWPDNLRRCRSWLPLDCQIVNFSSTDEHRVEQVAPIDNQRVSQTSPDVDEIGTATLFPIGYEGR